jgi:hypothetical protein
MVRQVDLYAICEPLGFGTSKQIKVAGYGKAGHRVVDDLLSGEATQPPRGV